LTKFANFVLKENLDEYAYVVFEEIIRSLNENSTPRLMDQAVGQVRGSDASSIRNINWILKGHEVTVKYISKLENGNIISGSDDMNIKLWDVDTRKCVKTLRGHDGGVLFVI